MGGGHGPSDRAYGPALLDDDLPPLTPAVGGVAVNVAVFFAWHVLLPAGTDVVPFTGGFQWFAAVVSVTDFVAPGEIQAQRIEVIGASAGLGLRYPFPTG